jgi:basic amino acid/polyamine antiporter, APA family
LKWVPSATTKPHPQNEGMPKLRRALGLSGLTMYGVGIIIGAGIYSVIGAAAALAGEALWLSFVIAAGVAVLTGLSYAELATALPRAGAEYVYLQRAFPRQGWVAFAAGLLLAFAGAATAATVALAFGGYLAELISVPQVPAAAALILVATAVNIAGIQESSWLNIALTVLEVLGLVLVIGAGLSVSGFGSAILAAPPIGLLSATALIFFVYLGFEEIANLSEEAKDAARDIPRAILLSVGLTAGLYVLVALAAVALVPAEQLADSDAPLATAVAMVSPVLADILGAIALFATANTVLVVLVAVSRMLMAMARGRDLPRAVANVLPGRRTPWVAAICLLLAAVALLPFGEVGTIASMSSLASLAAFASVNVALVVLRIREPAIRRPFRVPLSIARIPVLPVIGIIATGGLLLQFDALAYGVAGGVIAVGLGAYALRSVIRPRPSRPTT